MWCSIKSDELSTSKSSRLTQLRSLDTLREKHEEFIRAGGDLKKAKLYDNVIGKCFFDIPITQVKLLYN